MPSRTRTYKAASPIAPAPPASRRGLGAMPWGTHSCLFYRTREELLEVLTEYFREGIAGGDACVWVASAPLTLEEAEAALRAVVPDFDDRAARGQIEIVDHREWYLRGGQFDAECVLQRCLEKERAALRRGYAGLRVSGSISWLDRTQWKHFCEYEADAHHKIGVHRMIGLCAYPLDQCSAAEVFDVIRTHHFMLVNEEGVWKVTEGPQSQELRRSHQRAEFERKVAVEFLRLVNQSVGTRELVEFAARFFQQESGCEAIGIRLREGNDYPYCEARGFPQEFVRLENSLCVPALNGEPQCDAEGNPVLECMCGNVICKRFDPSKPFFTEQGSFWSNCTTDLLASTTDTDRQARTRNRCNGEGYESVALIRLDSGGESLGLLQLNDRRKNRFSKELIAMWERLAGYLSVALAKARAEDSVRESEQRFRAIASNTPDHILVQDKELRYRLVVNPQLGLTQEGMLGKTDYEVATREDAEKLTQVKRHVLTTGESAHLQTSLMSLRGELEDFDGTYVPRYDSRGKVDGLIGYFHNVTAQKKAEQELRQREALFRSLFESPGVLRGIVEMVGNDIRHISDNSAAAAFFGRSQESMRNQLASRMGVPQELLQLWLRHYRESKQTGRPVRFEYRHAMPEGEKWFLATVSFLDETAAGDSRYVYVAIDITERKLAEQSLREAQERLALATDAAQVGTYDYDLVANRLHWSPELKTIWGLRADDPIPVAVNYVHEGTHPDDRAYVGKTLRESLAPHGSGVLQIEHRVVCPDGSVRWVLARGRVYFSGEGETRHAVRTTGAFVDITDRKRAEEARSASERFLQGILRATPNLIYIYDLSERRNVYANQSILDFLGYRPEEIKTMGPALFQNILHPDDAPRVAEHHDRFASAGDDEVLYCEYRMKRTGGQWRWLRSCDVVFARNERGAACKILGSAQDITERKLAEQSLREAQERLALATDAAQIGIFDWNVLTGDVVWTRQHEIIFGYPPTTDTTALHRYSDWADRVHPDDLPACEAAIRLAIEGRTLYKVEYRILWPDGSMHWIAGQGRAYYDDAGRAVRMLGTVMDITRRKESTERVFEAQSVARLGFYDFNVATRWWTSSSVLDEIFGIAEDYERTVQGWGSLLHPEDRETILGYLIHDVLEGHKPFDREYRIIRRSDGQTRWMHGLGRLELDADGVARRLLGTIQDVTERRRAEEEKLGIERRLLHAQKLESLGILAGGIAHDFNNILAGIMGYCDLALLQLPEVSEVHKSLAEVKKASQRAADLTRQMLAYSGKGQFVVEPLDLSRIVEDCKRMLAISVSKKAAVTYDLATNLPAVLADAAQMHQVLMNLVINASEALGEEGGRIRVATAAVVCDEGSLPGMMGDVRLPAGRYVCLEVADSGCGMDRQTLRKVFDPFFTTKFTGRGLGLAAVQGIVQGHKGGICVASEPGKGTTFRVLLPASDLPVRPARRMPGEASREITGTVLVVDDEEIILNLSREMIQRLGCSVLTASRGADAVRVFRQRPAEIDCVLLDLTMPDMDGSDVFRQLRDIRPDVRVVLSSGYSEEVATERFAEEGLAGFLQKPYQFETIAAKLVAVLGDRPPAAPAAAKPCESASTARGAVVLIVDDDELSRNVTKMVFEMEGFATLTAENGEEALRIFCENRQQIACVFLDLNLPGMDGEETLAAMREIQRDVRVILASGGDAAAAAARCAGPGLIGYIDKPEPLDGVISNLRSALGTA